LDNAISQALRPFTLTVLRVLLGLLFVWFGGLKIIGRSPVAAGEPDGHGAAGAAAAWARR